MLVTAYDKSVHRMTLQPAERDRHRLTHVLACLRVNQRTLHTCWRSTNYAYVSSLSLSRVRTTYIMNVGQSTTRSGVDLIMIDVVYIQMNNWSSGYRLVTIILFHPLHLRTETPQITRVDSRIVPSYVIGPRSGTYHLRARTLVHLVYVHFNRVC